MKLILECCTNLYNLNSYERKPFRENIQNKSKMVNELLVLAQKIQTMNASSKINFKSKADFNEHWNTVFES